MAAASGIALELLEFLNAAPTPFHAVGMLDISFSSSPYLFFSLVSLPQNSGLGFGGPWDLVLGSRIYFCFILRGFSLALDTKEGLRRFFSASVGGGLWLGFVVVVLQQRKPNRG